MPGNIGSILNIISFYLDFSEPMPIDSGYSVLVCNAELPLESIEVCRAFCLTLHGLELNEKVQFGNSNLGVSMSPTSPLVLLGITFTSELFVFIAYFFEVKVYLIDLCVSISDWHNLFK